MWFIMKDYIYYFKYLACLIRSPIDVVDWHSLEKFVCIQTLFLYKVLVNEDSYSTRVN